MMNFCFEVFLIIISSFTPQIQYSMHLLSIVTCNARKSTPYLCFYFPLPVQLPSQNNTCNFCTSHQQIVFDFSTIRIFTHTHALGYIGGLPSCNPFDEEIYVHRIEHHAIPKTHTHYDFHSLCLFPFLANFLLFPFLFFPPLRHHPINETDSIRSYLYRGENIKSVYPQMFSILSWWKENSDSEITCNLNSRISRSSKMYFYMRWRWRINIVSVCIWKIPWLTGEKKPCL